MANITQHTKVMKLLNTFSVLATLALGVYFFLFVETYALNVPFHDDILDIVNFLMRFEDSQGAWESLLLLHEQHNDHRTAASRLVYIAAFHGAGEINFRLLALLANLALVLLLIGFSSQVRKLSYFPILLLIMSLLLLHPRAFALLTFPMAAFAFFYLYAYSFLTILFLHRPGRLGFCLAVLCAFIANFSIASGQFTWLFGAAVLIYRHVTGIDVGLAKVGLWLLISVFALVLFHVGLETPNDILTLIIKFFETPLHQTHFFLTMAGSVVGFESVFMSSLMGVVLITLLALLTLEDWPRGLGPLHWYAWFTLASAAVLSLGRAMYVDIDYALAPRYSFASMNFIVCLFLLVIQRPRCHQPAQLIGAVALAAIVCWSNYHTYTPIYDDYKERRLKRYNADRHWIFGYPMKQTNAIVQEAVDRGYYHPPAKPLK